MKSAHNPAAIPIAEAPTLNAIFRERVNRTPEATAYIQYDEAGGRWRSHSWQETALQVARWQAVLAAAGLEKGDRVAILCRNGWQWVIVDQAVLGLGLVLVPLYADDRPDNIARILADSGTRLLVVEREAAWRDLQALNMPLPGLQRVVTLGPCRGGDAESVAAAAWLPAVGTIALDVEVRPGDLATIVYTSGTTGRPKGVMLSHYNIVWNIHACLQLFEVGPSDRLLSFLPLSHTFERTVGYYLPMVAGPAVAYNRGIPQLAEDLAAIRPTILISVPRIFERVYARVMDGLRQAPAVKRRLFHRAVATGWRRYRHRQDQIPWSPQLLMAPLLDRLVGRRIRERLGGRLRFSVCGGAPLNPEVAKTFIGLGVPIVQGYGLTETSPVISVNLLYRNIPESVGPPLPGVETRLTTDNELLVRSPAVMQGYWNDATASARILDGDGWLHTGDRAEIDAAGHIHITGRFKDIIMLSNGEKIPPAELENAICLDRLIDQVLLVGEGRPYLAALVVPNREEFGQLLKAMDLDPASESACRDNRVCRAVLDHVERQLRAFPGYAQIRRLALVAEPWTPENGLMTPTLKLKRGAILKKHADLTAGLYAGH
ncbi:MAG: long-chain fatty acid--CoA ligase [Gammaproteobacteria bacterium]|nr:long-chain fatty acid--CoA ligase [Gammaproteobacteria bacterium]